MNFLVLYVSPSTLSSYSLSLHLGLSLIVQSHASHSYHTHILTTLRYIRTHPYINVMALTVIGYLVALSTKIAVGSMRGRAFFPVLRNVSCIHGQPRSTPR